MDTRIVLGIALVAVLVPVALVDIDRRLIPNRLLAPAAVLGVVLLGALERGALPEHVLAAAAAGGALLVAAVINPAGMGMGDVKLAALLGLFLGRPVGLALVVAVLGGAGAGLLLVARHGVHEARHATLPFGPFLAAGAVVALVTGLT
jgi:leader peptidase (prepilin peptidase)/N-methyltransferase